MELEVHPPPSANELAALRVALERADIRLEEPPAVYTSAWRLAAAREATGDEAGSELEP